MIRAAGARIRGGSCRRAVHRHPPARKLSGSVLDNAEKGRLDGELWLIQLGSDDEPLLGELGAGEGDYTPKRRGVGPGVVQAVSPLPRAAAVAAIL